MFKVFTVHSKIYFGRRITEELILELPKKFSKGIYIFTEEITLNWRLGSQDAGDWGL